VKIGKAGEEQEVYLYRGEVVNNAIKMAGVQVGLFIGKSEVTHRNRDYDDLIRKVRDEAEALLREHEARLIDVSPEDG
jgi:hypothetical protein